MRTYLTFVIKSVRHKALRNYWFRGFAKGLDAGMLTKIRRVLLVLDEISSPEDMNLPGWYFHSLVGNRAGIYSVRISGNYRLTFKWDGQDAINVDLEDYH